MYLSFLSIILSTWFNKATFPEYLSGHLRNNPKSHINLYHNLVFVKGGNKILAKSFTNHDGNFELVFYTEHINSFSFYCKTKDGKVLFLKTIKEFDTDNEEVTFEIP